MKGLHFADLQIGQTFPVVEHAITQEVIDRNAVASLDYNPVHTDIEWSRRTKVFGIEETVGHGMLTMSLMTSVITRVWYRYGAYVTTMESKFTKPVPNGDAIRCTGFIKELHPHGPGHNFVVVSLSATNRAGEPVGVCQARVNVPD